MLTIYRIFVAALVVASVSGTAMGASYYVDADSGNDSFSGRSADLVGTPATDGPWKTVSKVNGAQLQAGDAVYFRCGRRWRATLTISNSGVSGSPITIGQYGADCNGSNKPVLTAAETVSGWSLYSGNIYVAPVTFPVYQVFVDDQPLLLAQYPNAGFDPQKPDSVFLTIDPDPNGIAYTTRFTDLDLELTGGQDIVGAGVHIRLGDFIIDDRVVSAYDPTTKVVSLTAATQRTITDGWGYYFDNKLWMLDQAGEWYYDGSDPNNKKLYVWMPDGTDPGTRVIAGRDSYGVDAQNQSNLVITNLRIEKTGVGLQLSRASNFVAKNTEVVDSYYEGMLVNDSNAGSIDSCTITRTVREGIDGTGTNLSIANNLISDTGNIGSPKNSRGAIAISGEYSTIKNNSITRSGYHGISFSKNSNVSNNYIVDPCLVLNDCGGIYTGMGIDNLTVPHNSDISGNTVIGGYGNSNGRKADLQQTLASGIYIDYRSHDLGVKDNTVVGSDSGIYLHNTANIVIKRNKVYNSVTYALRFVDRGALGGVYGNVVSDNTFFASNDEGIVEFKMYYAASHNLTNMAVFSNNRYSALYASDSNAQGFAHVLDQPSVNSGFTTVDYTFPQWTQVGIDTGSTIFDDFTIGSFTYQNVGAPNLVANSTFDADVGMWKPYSSSSDATLNWSAGCQAGGCMLLSGGAVSARGSAISNNFSVELGKKYLVSFDARTLVGGQGFTALIRDAGPVSFDVLAPRQELIGQAQWQHYAYLIDPTRSAVAGTGGSNGARIDFLVYPNQALYLDNIRVEQVNAVNNDVGDDTVILLNPTAYTLTVNCPHTGVDYAKCSQYIYLKNSTTVTWPVSLPARASELIIWESNPFRVDLMPQ